MYQEKQLIDLLPALEAPVHGAQGEKLGQIARLWYDPQTGAIGNATLLLRNDADRGRLQITIPWSQFRLNRKRRLELPISRPVLIAVAQSAGEGQ